MDAAPAAATRAPCCVCDAPGVKHCTKCKSRHYCSKACQLVDWKEGGHKEQCKQLAAKFQDRLLDELMPAKLKIKEAPAIVEDVVPVRNTKAEAPEGSVVDAPDRVLDSRVAWTFAIFLRICASWAALLWRIFPEKLDLNNEEPAVRTTALAKANAVNDDRPDWRGTCAICIDRLPVGDGTQTFYSCCCKSICTECSRKCREYDTRCPLCRAPAYKSDAEWVSRMQKHVDKGNADAQRMLGDAYSEGGMGLKKSLKRMFQLYERAAAQGQAQGQAQLGHCYYKGDGVKLDLKTAAHWYRRAAEQGFPNAQYNLGRLCHGQGVAHSHAEAVRWWHLAAAQDDANAMYYLGLCSANGLGMPLDLEEALLVQARRGAGSRRGSRGGRAHRGETRGVARSLIRSTRRLPMMPRGRSARRGAATSPGKGAAAR